MRISDWSSDVFSSDLQTVIPSWAPAIISDTCSMACSVVRATREPACAFGSIWLRRAEISANSAPTKNALRARRRSVSSTPVRSLIVGHLLLTDTHREPVDPEPVHPLDREQGESLRLVVPLPRPGHGDRGHARVARYPAEHLDRSDERRVGKGC